MGSGRPGAACRCQCPLRGRNLRRRRSLALPLTVETLTFQPIEIRSVVRSDSSYGQGRFAAAEPGGASKRMRS